MEKDQFFEDEFLRDLVRKSPLESPADDFVDRIMQQVSPQKVEVKKPIFFYLKMVAGYAALALFVLIVLFTSDFPIFNFVPGKSIFQENIIPLLSSFIQPFKVLFMQLKSLTIPLMIVVSASLFFILDLFLSRNRAVHE